MSEKTPKVYFDTAAIAREMGVPPVIVCPKRAAKFPTTTARCSCGYVCSATSEDSNDAALFAHVVACHTVPTSDLLAR